MKMPIADNGMVRRDNIPAAMPSCIAAIKFELVFSSGVRMIPPTAQIEMKKKAVPARNIISVFSWRNCVARSIARIIAAPMNVPSPRQPHISAGIEMPNKNFEIGAKNVFQPKRLPGDVIGAKPFDVRVRSPGDPALTINASGIAAQRRQPPGQPAH